MALVDGIRIELDSIDGSTITLGSPIEGFRSLLLAEASGDIADQAVVSWVLEANFAGSPIGTAQDREGGVGVWDKDTNTIVRGTVWSTESDNAQITITGDAHVIIAPLAAHYQILTPEMFGAKGDGVTDDTDAFIAISDALREAGGGIMSCPPGKTYAIWSAGSTPQEVDHYTLFDLSGTQGVRLFFNGAKLRTNNEWTGDGTWAELVRSPTAPLNDFWLDGLDIEETETSVLDNATGISVVYSVDGGGRGWRFTNIRQVGGWGFFVAGADPLTVAEEDRIRDIWIANVYLSRVYYGFNVFYTCDHVQIRNLHCEFCERPYFVYGVHNHDVQLIDDDCQASSIIAVNGVHDPVDPVVSRTTDIKLRISSNRNPSESTAWFVNLSMSQLSSTSAPAILRNIDIEFDVARTGGPQRFGVLLNKRDHNFDPDTSTRGHIMENIRFSGTFDSQAPLFDNLFNASDGDFSVETVRNIIIERLVAEDIGTINIGGVTSNLVLDTVVSNSNLTLENYRPGVLSARSVSIPNFFTGDSGHLLAFGTVSAAALLDIDMSNFARYRAIEIVLSDLAHSTDSTLDILTSSDGVAFDTGGSDYQWCSQFATFSGGWENPNSFGSTAFMTTSVNPGTSENAAYHAQVRIRMTGHGSTAAFTYFTWDACYNTPADAQQSFNAGHVGGGVRSETAVVEAVRLLPSSGNFSFKYSVHGIN